MSLLSAGKQISVGNDKSYGRGLFIADPEQAERKARKKADYQEQLRSQMQEDRRRKEERKRKQQEEDMRLQAKIKEDLMKETEKKPSKPAPKNNNNPSIPPSKSQVFDNNASRFQQREPISQEPSNYKFNFHMHTQNHKNQTNPYLPRHYDAYQAEEERFFEESNTQKLRVMHEVLEEKLNEVFKKIKQSQDLEIEKEFDIIRKKIATSNGSYQPDSSKFRQFEGDVSHFYKVPKRLSAVGQSRTVAPAPRNLMYDSSSYPQKMRNDPSAYKPVTQQRPLENSRQQLVSRQSRFSNNDKQWGARKGKNYLGNREAMDYQINSTLGKIDNLLGGNEFA